MTQNISLMFDHAHTWSIVLMLKPTLVLTLMIFWFVCPVCATLSQQPASPPAMEFDCCCFLLQSRSLLVVVVVGGWGGVGGKGWEGWHGSSIFQRVKCASRVSHPELHAKSWRQLCTMSGAKARTCNRHMLGEGTKPKKNPKNNRFLKCIFFGHIPLQVRKCVSVCFLVHHVHKHCMLIFCVLNLKSVDVHSGIRLKPNKRHFFLPVRTIDGGVCDSQLVLWKIKLWPLLMRWQCCIGCTLLREKTLQLFLMMENTLNFGGCFARQIHFLPPNLASLEKLGAAPSTAVILTD